MADSPVLSASPGQEKSKHCISKVPDDPLGGVASSMVTRSGKYLENASSLNPTVLLDDCLQPKVITKPSKNECENCGKSFKGKKGVKIHQTKAKCTPHAGSNSVDCTLDPSSYETRPLASQESHHSALPRQLQNELIMLENISTKPALL